MRIPTPEPDFPRQACHRFSLGARLSSVRYAISGLSSLIRREHNARVHLAASLLVIAIGVVLHVSMDDWRWLVAAMVLVWTAEGFNTAIEALCDCICVERDPKIGRIKDISAGAVLVAAIGAASIGMLTFLPHLVEHLP